MKRALFAGALAAALVLSFAPRAQAEDVIAQKATCDDDLQTHASTDDQIAACTALIETGALAGTDLADVYFQRGLDYNEKLDPQHALADFTMALKLRPDYPEALDNRGTTFLQLHQYKDAIADLDAYLAVKSGDAMALAARARAERQTGEDAAAAFDMSKACTIDNYYCD